MGPDWWGSLCWGIFSTAPRLIGSGLSGCCNSVLSLLVHRWTGGNQRSCCGKSNRRSEKGPGRSSRGQDVGQQVIVAGEWRQEVETWQLLGCRVCRILKIYILAFMVLHRPEVYGFREWESVSDINVWSCLLFFWERYYLFALLVYCCYFELL